MIVDEAVRVVGRPSGVVLEEENQLATHRELVEFPLHLAEHMLVEGVGHIAVGLVVAVERSLAEHIVVAGRVGHMNLGLVVIEGEHTAVLEEHMVVVGLECQQLGRLVVELRYVRNCASLSREDCLTFLIHFHDESDILEIKRR